MAQPEQDVREKLAGEYKQGDSDPQLPNDSADAKPSTAGPCLGEDSDPRPHCKAKFTFEFVGDLELVLKVRIQSLKENDFIEIELNRQELSYQNLLQVSCCELGIIPEQVEKIRKLPNTLLRKDKDILRLQDFQEVELTLTENGNSELEEYTSSLTEKPCYNRNAVKMIKKSQK
ncbi:putative ANKRD40 C-terminal-like protein [Dasypus novemcinctus]|uniref:putative ANKRD40 C-terminal-like protein n=1 Tax=Dasypus novemcinctus TaxID=9361 RepID=UPI00265ED81B|nr:putative ANKRD40 C-terminal-like protein [Dasypus novemcinctus]